MKRGLLPVRLFLTSALVALAVAPAAHATTGGAPMPWDTGLANLADNLTGPTARALILIAIVVSGVAWAFTEHGTGGRKLSQLVFGGGVALAAVSFLAGLGFTGAMV